MRILRLLFLGLCFAVIGFAIASMTNKLPGQIAGIGNPLLIDNKFCTDPASPDQTGCNSFISSVLAQAPSSPYQTVTGPVSIDGKVGIGINNPQVTFQGLTSGSTSRFGIQTRTDGASIDGQGGAQLARFGGWYSTNPIAGSTIDFSLQGATGQRGAIGFLTKATDDDTNQPTLKMVITQGGRVGVGTANPGAKLAVNASGASTGIFVGDGTNAYGVSLLQINAPAGYVNWLFEIGKNNSSLFHVDANGNEYAVTNNQTSDRRLKTNITPLAESGGLASINQLKPVTFNWLSPDYTKAEQIGLIAQDIEKIFPQLVSEGGTTTLQMPDGTTQTVSGTKSLNYSGLIPPVVKAIQTLSQKVEAQQKEIDLLKQQIEALKAR